MIQACWQVTSSRILFQANLARRASCPNSQQPRMPAYARIIHGHRQPNPSRSRPRMASARSDTITVPLVLPQANSLDIIMRPTTNRLQSPGCDLVNVDRPARVSGTQQPRMNARRLIGLAWVALKSETVDRTAALIKCGDFLEPRHGADTNAACYVAARQA